MSQQPEQNKTADNSFWIKATIRLPQHMVRHSLKLNGTPYAGYYDYSLKRFMCPNLGPSGIDPKEVEWLDEEYASQQTASLQKQVDKWKNLYEAERDIDLQAIVTEQQQEIEALQKQVELLQIRDEKREARESNLHKENGGLHAQIESLQNQVHALEVQKKAILQRESETNRLYKKQVEELREENEDLGDRLTMAQEETYDQKCIVDQLQAENAAANKRIEELFKEKQELERKYNLLRYGSKD